MQDSLRLADAVSVYGCIPIYRELKLSTTSNAAGERIAGPDPRPAGNPELLDVHAVAGLLDCSPRHVYRLADGGRMPRPLKLGALVRWRRADVQSWIAAGCKAVSR